MLNLRALFALVLAATAVAGGSALAASAPSGEVTAASVDRARFHNPCGFSHRASDDPIVAPGRPGGSHSHDFFGNVSTGAHSDYESLRAAGTTCRRPGARAAYWMPTLFLDDRPITPSALLTYYEAGLARRERVRPYPPGLRVVAGSARAVAPQRAEIAGWRCLGPGDAETVPSSPQCPDGASLAMRVGFPGCWDGRNLDSPDHQGHMAYAAGAACPASHPVAVPRLVMLAWYPTSGGPDVRLSSGSPDTVHADFFDAWDPPALERLVRTCVNRPATSEEEPCRPGRRARLAVSASPGTAPVGARRAFRFRVTAPGRTARRPVRGATVRLGGVRARTGRDGRAQIVTRLRSRGWHRALVTAPGGARRVVGVRAGRK